MHLPVLSPYALTVLYCVTYNYYNATFTCEEFYIQVFIKNELGQLTREYIVILFIEQLGTANNFFIAVKIKEN